MNPWHHRKVGRLYELKAAHGYGEAIFGPLQIVPQPYLIQVNDIYRSEAFILNMNSLLNHVYWLLPLRSFILFVLSDRILHAQDSFD